MIKSLAKAHHAGQQLHRMNHWDQFIALAAAQCPGHTSLCDIMSNLQAQVHRPYYIGVQLVSCASPARVNER